VGLTFDGTTVLDLSACGVENLESVLEATDPLRYLEGLAENTLAAHLLSKVTLLPPIDQQEVWAAGVTYLRSKTARMSESDSSADAYDRVYRASRPELFFKSMPGKVVGTGMPVGIRKDAQWSVPEPELALVLNSAGRIVGYTIGNDMSSRDIEGENLLYLPQAKIYTASCALGPWIALGADEATVRDWRVGLVIRRRGKKVFEGETTPARIQRTFGELAEYLFRSQKFPHGAMLLTGTGIVPPDKFSLLAGDEVTITIGGIGELKNKVILV
jgi:2-dehydro-3-deoxy-D-arabinonate dehydratase